MTERSLTLPLAPPAAWAALESTAEEWGAELAREDLGGRLRLPVLAGLRRGVITGRITVEPADGGSRVAFRPEEAGYTLQVQAVVVLAFAVAGAAAVVAWPFFPRLLSVAPFGALLALGGWFLVISRLRTSGPDEFLAAVQQRAAQEDE